MKNATLTLNELYDHLYKILEHNYTPYGTRKKTRLANRPISAWGTEQNDAVDNIIQAIKQKVALANPDPTERLRLFTDASELNWSGVLTQVQQNELNSAVPTQERNHHPVAFVSG